MPLGPLMIRQPRQTSSRQRLKILDPFPMNPSYWNEYAEDTLNYLLEIEGRYDRYMYKGPDVDFPSHRATLVQWLVELCYGCFSYQPNTLHIAVNLLDRYLSAHGVTLVPLDQLQCVGMCALMIAGKMEENTIKLEIFELCRLCDLYTPRQIASTELSILVALKFEVLVSSASGFSDYFKRAISAPPMVIELIDFLCDLSLISYKFLDFSNSQIAAAAVWIALCAIHQDWSEELAILTGYSRTDLTPCSMLFRELVCSQIDTVDLRSTLGHKYPLEQILATLTYVLQ
ncbi:cyclin-like protein [Gamsiella multidivaricata]|uniref:cyclin-like protein n=1 Tax=Gamsiella multidivaricata TaxID=101098 RepID=UPI00221FCC36|nr:cyclin-like protein [Gamsiella multidivaricata]KAI7818035.1 cyclin-like protein [Gamsiella multidivaricata]